MGRTIAKHFFHPYEANPNQKKEKLNLKNWTDKNSPFYYDQIPIYMQKIYRSIDIKLENECKSLIPSEQCLPQIAVSGLFLEELKNHITNSPLYESVKFKINYNEELPELLDLLKSHEYFMYYLHIPKREDGRWFCEGRFFTYSEIEKTADQKLYKTIEEFVKKKNINYMDFLEEWVGLIFHLSAEFLLFKKKVKVIFFSCEKCYRPALFVKEEIINEDDDVNKIWGTVNIVDTIIYNCTQENFSSICKVRKRSKNNIIYHDESFLTRTKYVKRDFDRFKNETDGAFFLTTNEGVWDNLIEEFKSTKGKNFKFDLIITGTTAEKILNKIHSKEADDFFDRICIYTFSKEKNLPLMDKYDKIEGVFTKAKEVINFINSYEQKSEIYSTIQLYTYDNYIKKYSVLHKKIAAQYGKDNEDCYKKAISLLKDFLLWYPKLKAKSSIKEKLNIESLLETLQRFKDINDNEEDIIQLYTKESDSYYKDFNNWLNISDPLAIQKTSWFIAGVMYSLNKYAEKNDKGLKKTLKLYRGIRSNLYDLLNYQRAKGKIICFPSFTSTSRNYEVAERFAFSEDNYKTIITIDYKHKKGFLPTAVDVSKLAIKEHEYEEECLFLPYSFFIIQDVEINHKEKTAKIELTSIGRKKILENYLKEGINLVYNKDGFMEEQIEKEGEKVEDKN